MSHQLNSIVFANFKNIKTKVNSSTDYYTLFLVFFIHWQRWAKKKVQKSTRVVSDITTRDFSTGVVFDSVAELKPHTTFHVLHV